MTSAIRTENLSKRFRRTVALDGLNLDVPEGSIYGLVGVNGAGKTTAIKVLMNILRLQYYAGRTAFARTILPACPRPR
jgi:ABC-type multidrug transport system ATPase subunit